MSLLLFNASTCTRLNYMAEYYSILDSRQRTHYGLLITVPLTKYVNFHAPPFYGILYSIKNIDTCLETRVSRPGFSLNYIRKYMAGSHFSCGFHWKSNDFGWCFLYTLMAKAVSFSDYTHTHTKKIKFFFIKIHETLKNWLLYSLLKCAYSHKCMLI